MIKNSSLIKTLACTGLAVSATVYSVNPAQAAIFVLGSTASTTLTTTGGSISHITNQSGLSTAYTSGVTNFATYSATHTTRSLSNSWTTSSSSLGGYVTFDLGALYDLRALALWNIGGTTRLVNFSLYADTNANTSSVGTLIGSFSAAPSTSPFPIQRFYFTNPVTTQFVQMRLDSNSGGSTLGLVEVAFGGSTPAAVPEPLTILGAATAIGFGANFKRRLAKAKQSKKSVV